MQATFAVIEEKFRMDEGFIKDGSSAGKKEFGEAKPQGGGDDVSSQAKGNWSLTLAVKKKRKKRISASKEKCENKYLTLRSTERRSSLIDEEGQRSLVALEADPTLRGGRN